MHRFLLGMLLAFCLAPFPNSLLGQYDASQPDERKSVPPDKVRLPNGKLQQEEIMKIDHEKVLQDVNRLVALSQELQHEVEQAGTHVLSIPSIHKTEEIEKLAKHIRSRMRGY